MPLNTELLQELVDGLRKRATSCGNWPGTLSELTLARLKGKASAYDHAADLVEQTVDLLESPKIGACPNCRKELVCEECARANQ